VRQMSGHTPKHGAQGGQPEQRRAPPKQALRRELRADFLLNFRPNSQQRQYTESAPRQHKQHRPSNRVAFVRGRFVQSSFRIFVDGASPDVVDAALCADELISWQHVCRVDLLCEVHPTCPICLEGDMVVPKITRCGHIFCAPCIMRYFLTMRAATGKNGQRCPICQEHIVSDDLTSVRFQLVKSVSEGSRMSFLLVSRNPSSTIVWATKERETGDAVSLPSEADWGWHFSRVVELAPGEALGLLLQEREALHRYRPAAIGAGDTELIPSIDAAVDLLERRYEQRLALGASGPPIEVEESFDWGCHYVDVVPSRQASETVGTDAGGHDRQSDATTRADNGITDPDTTLDTEEQVAPISRDAAVAGRLAGSGCHGGRGRISFYQGEDGRLFFLQPFFTKLLLHEHGNRWDQLPAQLVNVRLERLHDLTLTEDVRKRYRFISHLPLGSQVTLVEVDLSSLRLSQSTLEFFGEELQRRREQRAKDRQRSKKEALRISKRAAAEEERFYKSLDLVPSYFQTVPTKEDFAVPLPGRTVDAEAAEASLEEDDKPTLADKIKEKKATEKSQQDLSQAFPTLGCKASVEATPASSSRSAWGAGRGSDRTKSEVLPVATLVKDSWDEDSDDSGTLDKRHETSFGHALSAALSASSSAKQDDAAELVESKKKKGRAGKAKTIRLFG